MYSLNMLAMAMELAARESRLRGRREQVLGALPLHRAGDEQHRPRRTPACGTRTTASSTTSCTRPSGEHVPLKVRSMVGLIPLFAVETLEPRAARPPAGLQEAPRMVRRPSSGPDRATSPACARAARAERRLLVDRRPRALEPGAEGHARRERVPVAVRHPGALAVPPRASVRAARRRRRPPRRLRAGGIDRPACSAATPTGGDRSGCRSTSCSSKRLQKFHHYFGDELQGGVPDRIRHCS